MKSHENSAKENTKFISRFMKKIKAHKTLTALILTIIAIGIGAAILVPSLIIKKPLDTISGSSQIALEKADTSSNAVLNQSTDSDTEQAGSKAEASVGMESENTMDADKETSDSEASNQEASKPEASKPEASKPEDATHKHSYSAKVIKATCEQGGYTLYTCSCGQNYTGNKTSALGHLWNDGTVTKKPSYVSTGTMSYACSRCGATKTSSIPVLKTTDAERRNQVFELVNEQRVANGLPKLQYCTAAQAAADLRAKELAKKFSHTRPDGSLCWSVFPELGISHPYMTAENIASGYATPEAVMAGWMESDGHRANILSGATGIVIGVDFSNGRANWVQIFVND